MKNSFRKAFVALVHYKTRRYAGSFSKLGRVRQNCALRNSFFNILFCNLPRFWFSNRHINERDVIIWGVLIAIISRNILRKFLGWQSLIRLACRFKLQNEKCAKNYLPGFIRQQIRDRIFGNFTYFSGRTWKIIFHIRVLWQNLDKTKGDF
jgi:hypothetical protein